MDIIHRNENLEIYYDTKNQWLYCDWSGRISENNVRQGCDTILSIVQLKKSKRVFSDNRKVVHLIPPADNWVGLNWFPMLQEAGVQKFAWVVRTGLLISLKEHRLKSIENKPAFVEIFNNAEAATIWLNKPAESVAGL